MPQVFQVLKCYKCSVFQIHQTKKSNKFECKLCGERQSIKRHYGIGTSKDCRIHVQKLNVLRGNMDIKTNTEIDSDEEYVDSDIHEQISENINNSETIPLKRSKWSEFIDKEKENELTEEPMFLGDKQVLLELPRKTKTRHKAKSSNSEKSLPNIDCNSKDELGTNLEFTNEHVDNFGSEEVPVQNMNNDDTSSVYKEQSIFNNVHNLVLEKSPEKSVINKNSRWAQYVCTEDYPDPDNVVLSNEVSKEIISNSDNLFSLCDDNDLDVVLDI